jgi:predicted nicotinamide N-methyase
MFTSDVKLGTVGRRFTGRLRMQTNIESSDEESDSKNNTWQGKDIYQRVFYRFSTGSDVDIQDAVVAEERCRFAVDPQRPDYIIPVGQRTLILRNGRVDDGDIGDDFFTVNIPGSASDTAKSATHNGAGNDPDIQSAIVCALYLASNPNLCQGRILELSADSGLGSLLGCIGAGYSLQSDAATLTEKAADIADDILTIAKGHNSLFPPELEVLTISDVDDVRLTKVLSFLKGSSFASESKVALDILDWRVRAIQQVGTRMSSLPSDFRMIVASDVAFSYPESKQLARVVANRLEATAQYVYKSGSTLPSFVYITPDDRDEVTYLRRILEKGYRMSTSSKYLKLEKLVFHLQKIQEGEPESVLDDLELELKEVKEIRYQTLQAQHHPDYLGGGSGEFFFPLETGEYDATSGTSFLEKEAESGPW